MNKETLNQNKGGKDNDGQCYETLNQKQKQENEMKNGSKTVKTPASAKLEMDPISVSKRKLDEARIDYKRIKEINAGPKTEKEVNPKRVEIREKMKVIKDNIAACMTQIKASKALIIERRKQIKEQRVAKKELKGNIKKVPRAPKNKAVKDAQIELLTAELAYRKACLG